MYNSGQQTFSISKSVFFSFQEEVHIEFSLFAKSLEKARD